MVRPYAVKGRKRKRRDVVNSEHQVQVEKEEEEEEEEEQQQQQQQRQQHEEVELEEEINKKKKKREEEEEEKVNEAMVGIPIVPSSNVTSQKHKPRAIFVLERACLEVAKVGKTYQLLNSDDHVHFLQKHNRNRADYRPDILHQALLSIVDSPLNKAGMVRAIYVRTEKGVLFEVKPNALLPRTFKRFSGLMLQLLQKLGITATNKHGTKGEKLLRVIKNPVTRYLPLNSRKVGLSYSSEKLVQLRDYVNAASNDVDLVFVVGAMAHGKINHDYTDDFISVSGYPLSAACCIGRICNALEQKWNIL